MSLLQKSGRLLCSLRLTVALLGLGMVLIFVATIAQVEIGIREAQLRYFRSWIAWLEVGPGTLRVSLPLPGGLLLASVLLVNLLAAHLTRFKLQWKKAGIFLIHTGVLLLLLGELFTALLGWEAQIRLDEGETLNYSTHPWEVELVIIDSSAPGEDSVTAIPQSRLRAGAVFPLDGFTVRIERFLPNSEIVPAATAGPEFEAPRATEGPGVAFAVREVPEETAPDRRNLCSAFVEIIPEHGSAPGRWLLSNAISGMQEFKIGDALLTMAIRQRRFYHPFSITLLDFSHDRYLGTEIPKNFSSRIRIMNADRGEDRETLIYMNHPLRYGGLTFYQSGFDNDDTTSIIQVVRNPAWTLPYIACAMVALGLLWVFSQHLVKAIGRRRAEHAS